MKTLIEKLLIHLNERKERRLYWKWVREQEDKKHNELIELCRNLKEPAITRRRGEKDD